MPLSTFLNGRPPVRGLLWLALSDTATISTRTITSDAGGGGTATWGTVGTAIACRVDPLGANSRITGGAIDERSTHLVTIPVGSTVDVQNRVLIAGRGTYEVTAVRDRTDALAQTFEVLRVE